MVARVTWVPLLIAGFLLSCSSFAAERAPEARAVLKAAAQTYSALRSYHFVSTTKFVSADGSELQTLGQVLAGTSEGKTRHEMDTPMGRIVSVSDGKTEWTYFPASNEYMVTAPGSGPLSNLNAEFIRSYGLVDTTLVRSVTWLRTERLSLKGRRVTCDVIRVEMDEGRPAYPDPEADRLWRAEWNGIPKTYWIDRARHRILRTSATSTKGTLQETTYRVACVNEELSAELFRSPVPPRAKKIEPPR